MLISTCCGAPSNGGEYLGICSECLQYCEYDNEDEIYDVTYKKINMLTLEQLKEMPPETVFAQGEIENSPDGIFMTDSDIGRKMIWAAKKGGVNDWAIYIHWAVRGIDYVISNGDKVTVECNIRKLVPCTDEVFKMYNY